MPRSSRSSRPEAVRYIGDARVELSWSDRDDAYYGRVVVADADAVWEFDDLRPSPHDRRTRSVDEDEMWDKMAASAVSFGSDPQSNPELHDAIEYATAGYQDDQGRYEVRHEPRDSRHYVNAGRRRQSPRSRYRGR